MLARGQWLRVGLLPLLLMGAVYAAGGFYYEGNDDPTMTLLLRGITAAAPVGNLHMYLGWWSCLLATLYTWVPAFPWYDTLLATMMYASLATAFYALEAVVRPALRGWRTLVLETVFFGAVCVPHLLQVSFTRPALLLGFGAGLLLALPTGGGRRSTGRWVVAGLLLVAAWQLRPQAAELGVLLTAPFFLLHPWRRTLAAGLSLTMLGGLLALGTWLQESPAGATYARINEIRTQAFDYQHYTFALRTPADSITHTALSMGMGPYDAGLMDEAFFRRCLRPAPTVLVNRTILGALRKVVVIDLRKWHYLAIALTLYCWFLVVRAQFRKALADRQRAFWVFGLYQGFFWALYLGVSLYFHHVSRVAQPMITAYLLANLVLVYGFMGLDLLAPRLGRITALGWVLVIAGAMSLNALHERRELQRIQKLERSNAVYLAQLRAEAGGRVLVEGGLYYVMDRLQLFKPYEFLAYRRIVTLGGWSIYDPSQPALRRYLTGQTNTAEALLALGRQPRVVWVMKPAFAVFVAQYLNFRLHRPTNHSIRFVLANRQLPAGAGPRRYLFLEN